MLLKIGGALLIIIVGFLGYVAVQDPAYMVSREITINASPDKIFPHLNNSKLADVWGPWKEVDPEAKMVFSGPEEGVGAKTNWDSNGQLGTASATIVESIPNQSVKVMLEYEKPFKMVQEAVYSITPFEESSVVKWTVTGNNHFISRIFCVFMDMDKMVGGIFEKGLLNLKTLVETNNTKE